MRVFQLVIFILAALLGVVFAALNTVVVTVDLYFLKCPLPLGVLLLACVLLGALLAAAAMVFGSLLPLRRKLRKLERAAAIEASRRSGAL